MHTNTLLRGLAVLALLCFALPRAEATTITVNPATTAIFLDITIDVNGHFEAPQPGETYPEWVQDTHPRATAAPFGWHVDSENVFRGVGSIIILTPDGDKGYSWGTEIGFTSIDIAIAEPDFGTLFSGKIRGGGVWPGSVPTLTRVSNVALNITWDISEQSVAVPDAGSSVVLLALTLCGLMVHRRREMPSPRAVRGV